MDNSVKRELWNIFRKYHYLNTDLHKSSTQYIGILNEKTLVCHTGVIPAAMKKGVKRVHRLVVLPEFQGIGIGTHFIEFIAGLYDKQGYKFNLITTTPALRFALDRSESWNLRRSGKVEPPHNKHFNESYAHLYNSFSCNRVTYSYDYVSKQEPING